MLASIELEGGRHTSRRVGERGVMLRECDAALAAGIDPAQALRETDPSGLMEGLYIKVEEQGAVLGRYKFVRAGFLQTVLESGSHWMDRPLLPNRLSADVSLW